MKPGRPKRHFKPAFITVEKEGRTLFYELDAKGMLVRTQGKIKAHHIREDASLVIPSPEQSESSAPTSPPEASFGMDLASLEPIRPQFEDIEFTLPTDVTCTDLIVSFYDF